MNKKTILAAIMASSMLAGCAPKGNNINEFGYKVINAELFVEHDFSMSDYLNKNNLEMDDFFNTKKSRKISDSYIAAPINVVNKTNNERFVHILILSSKLKLVGTGVFSRSDFDTRYQSILNGLYKDGDYIFIDGKSFCIEKKCSQGMQRNEKQKIKNIIVINDKEVIKTNESNAFENDTMLRESFYSVVNINNGDIFGDVITYSEKNCPEDRGNKLIVCPSLRYKTEKKDDSFIVTTERIKRNPISFVINADKSRIINKNIDRIHYKNITINAFGKDLDVSLVRARKNKMTNDMSKKEGLRLDVAAFIYKEKVAGFPDVVAISTNGLMLSKCNVLISLFEQKTKEKTSRERLSSFNICKLKG